MSSKKFFLYIIFLLFFHFLVFFSPHLYVLAQEEDVGSSRFEQKQVLVRYSDEAKMAVFNKESKGDSTVSTDNSVLDLLLSFIGLSSLKEKQQPLDEKKIFNQLKANLGIYEQISLERKLPVPHTIKFKKAKITPKQVSAKDDPLANVYLVKFDNGTVDQAVRAYLRSGLVTEAQPNYIYGITGIIPNDSRFNEMWNLQKIKAQDAWDISTGGEVNVAVIDSGVDYSHPDLADNMWTNTVEGQITHGWDFVDNDGNPQDGNGHGTHVAGTIAAIGNNGIGVVGVNWKAKIMAVRVMGNNGEGNTAVVSKGVRFAADNGAKVINMSLGGVDETCGRGDQITSAAISYATDKGSLSVVAAGNNGANAACFSPANHPDVLAVSAVGSKDERAGYSNYGLASWKETKLVAAPGGNAPGGSGNCTIHQCILSTWPGGRYIAIQGTSMASPHVAGLAALILSKKDMEPLVLRQHLVNTADDVGGDFAISQPNPNIDSDDKQRSLGKRINAYRALTELGETVNPTVTPAGPTFTPVPGQPTNTPILPTPTPTGVNQIDEISIWTTAWINNEEVSVPNGSKLQKGTPVSILYNRGSGFLRLTIDRGGRLVKPYTADCIEGHSRYDRFCSPLQGGFLHAGSQRFFPLGELASEEGSPHVYTLESGGERVSTTIYVTN